VSASAPTPGQAQAAPGHTAPEFGLAAPDDATFAARAPQIEAYLLANFPGLRGLRQHRPHFDPTRDRTTDPIEHTLEMIALLDTGDLDEADATILRAAAVFHDVGKLLDPLNIYHAVESSIICAPYLPDFGLDAAASADTIAVIRNHDVLGRLARYWLTAQEAANLLGTRRLALLTERLTVADISSIRGLGSVLPTIAASYAAVVRVYDLRESNARSLSTPPEDGPTVRWPVDPRAELWLARDGLAGISAWHIELLEAIAESGSVAAGAERRAVPVATARRRLRAAERELGVPLLVATGRGSALTPEARDLIRRWHLFAAGIDTWVREHFRSTFGASGPITP
jgi:DNA-binding transcriptional LysR family regulator